MKAINEIQLEAEQTKQELFIEMSERYYEIEREVSRSYEDSHKSASKSMRMPRQRFKRHLTAMPNGWSILRQTTTIGLLR